MFLLFVFKKTCIEKISFLNKKKKTEWPLSFLGDQVGEILITLSKYKIFKTHIKGSIPFYILNIQNDIIVKINMLYKNEFLWFLFSSFSFSFIFFYKFRLRAYLFALEYMEKFLLRTTVYAIHPYWAHLCLPLIS